MPGPGPGLLVAEQRLVIAIVLADELVQRVVLRQQRKVPPDDPRLREDVRILNRRLVAERVEVRPAEALDDVQRLGVPVAVDLRLVVVADRVDDERVAVPAAYR